MAYADHRSTGIALHDTGDGVSVCAVWHCLCGEEGRTIDFAAPGSSSLAEARARRAAEIAHDRHKRMRPDKHFKG